MNRERRLGDRVLYAMELALDQGDLQVAEILQRAMEVTLTRFGGPNATDKREPPEGMELAYERLEALRHQQPDA